MKLLFIYAVLWLQTEIPFKPADEFQVNVDLKFKSKPYVYNPDNNGRNEATYIPGGIRVDKPGDISSFLSVNIVNLKIQPDEERILVIDSQKKTLLKKKTSPIPELNLEFGFVDEIKSKKVAAEITIYFLSHDKKELRKIVMTVAPEGDFLVNGKWHGHF